MEESNSLIILAFIALAVAIFAVKHYKEMRLRKEEVIAFQNAEEERIFRERQAEHNKKMLQRKAIGDHLDDIFLERITSISCTGSAPKERVSKATQSPAVEAKAPVVEKVGVLDYLANCQQIDEFFKRKRNQNPTPTH